MHNGHVTVHDGRVTVHKVHVTVHNCRVTVHNGLVTVHTGLDRLQARKCNPTIIFCSSVLYFIAKFVAIFFFFRR